MPGAHGEEPNPIAMLGQAYSLLGFRIVKGVVGAGYPQKPKHSAVFAQISPDGSRLTELARKAHMTPQFLSERRRDVPRSLGPVGPSRPSRRRASFHQVS